MSRAARLTMLAVGAVAIVAAIPLVLDFPQSTVAPPDRTPIGATTRASWTPTVSGERTRRPTEPMDNHTPELSPAIGGQGGLIIFAMNDDLHERGSAGLFATRLGGTPRLIIGSEEDDVSEACPAFSPDGRLLAYGEVTHRGLNAERAKVVIVSVDERGDLSPLHRLPGGLFNLPCPEWSPDGSAVAWIDGTQLWVAALDGAPTGFDLSADRGGYEQDIAWTHDSAAIALALLEQVLLVPVDGSEPRILMSARTDGDLREEFHSVAASPTDPMLAVAGAWFRTEPGGVHAQESAFLRVLEPDGLVSLEETGQFMARRPWGTGAPEWSPDGTRLAWGADDGLNMLDVHTGTPVAIEPGPWRAERGRPINLASSVRWSRDGTRLLFIGFSAYEFALASIAVEPPSDPIVLTDWGFDLYAESGEDLAWQFTSP